MHTRALTFELFSLSGRRTSSRGNHVRQPSLEAGVLRLYKWEGPGGRDASPGMKREAAIVSVVAVVCCSEEDAAAMLDYCGWDVTHGVFICVVCVRVFVCTCVCTYI